MKYMGSKSRIAKELLPIILEGRHPDQWYVEPFVGGFNMIDKVGGRRIANDSNSYLTATFKALQRGWVPPFITEELYLDIRNNKDKYEECLVGYVGFSMSFGGKWFGGWRRDKGGIVKGSRDDVENTDIQNRRSKRSVLKQSELIRGITILNQCYTTLDIPKRSIVYCDPPYEGTTKYKDDFNHDVFWNWVRQQSNCGHSVFVSEYRAPSDFRCVWEKAVPNTLERSGGRQGVEKLFVRCEAGEIVNG